MDDFHAASAENKRGAHHQGVPEFLRDLYDRLTFEVIRVPPLREREGDIEVLSRHFLQEFMHEIPAFGGKALSGKALDALGRYEFPGNVRELKNIIERAAYRDTTNEITFEEQVEAFKERLITDALHGSGGNQAAAARSLGLSYHQFRYYHKKYSR